MFSDIVRLIIGLSWPILLAWALWFFREQIKTVLVNRTIKVRPGVLEVGLPQQQPPTEAQKEPGLAPKSDLATGEARGGVALQPASSTLPAFRDFLTEVEQRLDHEMPRLMTGRSREETLKYLSVDSSAALYLERASRYIFGSQLDAINLLLANNGRTRMENLRPLYGRAAALFPAFYNNYSFEQWLSFLTQWNLVRIEGDDCVLTPAGRAIIIYMQIWRYLVIRPVG
jgi:hypothetical protein